MFKVKKINTFNTTKGGMVYINDHDAELFLQGYKWRVIEEKFDGTESEYGVFCLKVKADLVALLLNETALVEVK